MNDKTKIAIYGLSTETERVLPNLINEYDVVGLLDGFKTEGEIYGYPIVSMDYVINQGIKKIIVVARPGSCKAIEKRIGNICRQYEIELFDIRGQNLLDVNKVIYDFNAVEGYTYAEILEKICAAEVISFDLFDTLIMRNALYSSDVIDIMVTRLKERGVEIPNLAMRRLEKEKCLSQNHAPSLVEIYSDLLKEESSDYEALAKELATLEFETDLSLLVPRKDTIRLFDEAKRLEKKVYITTDTYYSKEQITKILELNSIQGYEDVIVSSEYKTGKTQKLFSKLTQIANTNNILHIGDDIVSDIQAAERNELKSIRIYSGLEQLDFVGGLGLYETVDNLSDRIRAGMFVASIFNSPFQFEDSDKSVKINSSYDLGYQLFAPMVSDFVSWFGDRVKEYDCKNIWFGARDGYLIQKIYKLFYPDETTEYFLTSRTAAIRAGVECEKDIRYVEEMKFSGEREEALRVRFGLGVNGLLEYTEAILKNAIEKRKNNKRYIEKLKIESGEIAFFDFVAKGTSQMYIQRLVDNPMIGLYFLQLEPEYMKDKNLRILSFYSEDGKETSSIFENYYILETILTSPDSSVLEFSNLGTPIYDKETRSKKDIECILHVQQGILSYIEKYISICPKSERVINKKLCEVFLSLIHSLKIQENVFLELKVEDPFFNRNTNMCDLL